MLQLIGIQHKHARSTDFSSREACIRPLSGPDVIYSMSESRYGAFSKVKALENLESFPLIAPRLTLINPLPQLMLSGLFLVIKLLSVSIRASCSHS